MAQADSVPTAIPPPITGATAKVSTNGGAADRRCFGSDARSGNTDTSLIPLWREKRREAEPDEQADLTRDLDRRCRPPVAWYVVAVSCTTVVILLGLPSTILFILLLFSSNKRLRLGEIDTLPSARPGSSE
jgi:hypothetical protein